MTSEQKFKQWYPTARIERGYAGMENRVFVGTEQMSGSFGRPVNAWADASHQLKERQKHRAKENRADAKAWSV